MESDQRLRALLAAVDDVLPEYRTSRPGKSLTDAEAQVVLAIGKWQVLWDEGVKDGDMGPYLGAPALHKLQLNLRSQHDVDAFARSFDAHAHTLARKAKKLAQSRQRADLDEALRLRSVERRSTTVDIEHATNPLSFEDPTGAQQFGDHKESD